jgi:5'-nucleotidase
MTRDMSHLSISIFHTNDMHGHLEEISRLSSFARRLREQARAEGKHTFLWDAGDAADRRIQICSATKGAAFQGILNAMGYSLQTMGNAISLPYGPQAMAEIAARSDFPILAANCRDGDGPLVEGLQESIIVDLPGGIILGVFGLTSPWDGMYEIFGLRFPDFVTIARRLVSELRQKGSSIILVLSHLGLIDDRILADEVDGIDIIIGAHTHDRLDAGEIRNGVLIAQAGEYAEALGRVDLRYDLEAGKIIAKEAVVLDVPPDISPDPAVLAAIQESEGELIEVLAQVIGEIEEDLDLDYFGECGLGNMAADALRERMEGEVAILAAGQFRNCIPKGTLTVGILDEACFSSANPYLSEIKGKQLLEALERGLDPAINEFMHHGLRGSPIGIPQISGLKVEYYKDIKTKPRIRQVLISGEPLDLDREYRVAHTDQEITADYGYLVIKEEQTKSIDVPTILSEVLADHVKRNSPVPTPELGRWIGLVESK